MPEPLDPRLWAKEQGLPHPYPIGCHSLDAGAMADTLWDQYLTPGQRRVIAQGWAMTEPQAKSLLVFLASLHDLCKITPGFQHCAPQADRVTGTPGYTPTDPAHSRLSHQRGVHLALPELLNRLFDMPLTGRPSRLAAHQLGQILGGHHGTYQPALSHQGNELTCPLAAAPGLGDGAWDGQREALVQLATQAFGQPKLPERPAPGPVAVLTTGLITLADWLVSQGAWVRTRQRAWDNDPTGDWQAHTQRALAAAPATIRAAQLTPPNWRTTTTFTALFPHLDGRDPHPLQQDLTRHLANHSHGAGLLLITAPPAEGKTEAALFAERIMANAAGTNGLAFLLPTMATTDAMFTRIRNHARTNCHGPTPVALLHSMAWLNNDYTLDDLHPVTSDPTTVTHWLRGPGRGLLAGIAVGTWDQAALGALPHRYMALRWLGLSGKTVVIDEVHAYDAHGHALTLRLLEWLGALQVPVILLSATVTGTTASSLVHAYRRGAGHPDTPPLNPSYPGWTYTDTTTGDIHTSPQLHSNRAHQLTITTFTCTTTHNPDKPQGRARQILTLLEPLATTRSGSALIVCNTVADVQATRRMLTKTWGTGPTAPLVRSLHARMPARQRTAITRRLQRWTGPGSTRPARPIVVITSQIAEQSLDVDFDLIITDLAPLALLLQRAGRGHRHPRTDRPTWAPTGKPRLAVLIPRGKLPPAHWGTVYDASLLRRTSELLHRHTGKPIDVPGQVQALIDEVYGPAYADTDDLDRITNDSAKTAIADLTTIPRPHDVRDLYPLTNSSQHPDLIATRLGADNIRVLAVYTTNDGNHWLHPTDRSSRSSLPAGVAADDRQAITRLINATVPISRHWLHDAIRPEPPDSWAEVPALRDVQLLPHRVNKTAIEPLWVGTKAIQLDLEDGITRQ
ncbi:CRISPR-associated helicase Cas3' [Streptacidiphilus sp. N1-10]|uniref:CRISPR-associated helicase Cas3 n=1 Tax=Streptacidiphilus jeojiensis TaxID=3229225 RepID=A0ABV6XY17_9ACTN